MTTASDLHRIHLAQTADRPVVSSNFRKGLRNGLLLSCPLWFALIFALATKTFWTPIGLFILLELLAIRWVEGR